MRIFESTLLLLVAAVGLAALARRWHAPYPALLAALGVALAFLPGMPRFVLEPQLALALFVAPVLLDAAFDTSPRDLRDDDPVEREVAAARQAALRAALAIVDGDRSRAADTLRFESAELWPDAPSGDSREHAGAGGLRELRQRAVRAARAELAALVANDTLGDDAFHRLEVELDRAELRGSGAAAGRKLATAVALMNDARQVA